MRVKTIREEFLEECEEFLEGYISTEDISVQHSSNNQPKSDNSKATEPQPKPKAKEDCCCSFFGSSSSTGYTVHSQSPNNLLKGWPTTPGTTAMGNAMLIFE